MSNREARISKVKNKNPAAVQITAEQILREANQFQEAPPKIPLQKIVDREELDEYKLKKRKEFEDKIRRNRTHIGHWIKYATWEESQHEYERARSIYERALDVDHRNPAVWINYANMEMKHRNVNHARNIWDRAVAILPRVDMFWYKYTYMEEVLGNVAGARQVFERWMTWEPSEEAWTSYIKFEKRYKEFGRGRQVFERFVSLHPEPKNWLKWAKFEEDQSDLDRVRAIFEQCIDHIDTVSRQSNDPSILDPSIFVAFAKFEIRQREPERARAIYKYALERVPQEGGKLNAIQDAYALFEKQHGEKEGIEDVITTKRRVKYEDELKKNSHDYDTWFDFARLEESAGEVERIREVYERAIAQVPPIQEKRYWKRYIYLWIFYAVWEERDAKDMQRAKEVYEQCIKIIPHKKFTFAKVWLLYADFLIRQNDVILARKNLGTALGVCPKEKLFRGYIELELRLREFDRARTLYEKYLEWNPANCYAWIKYAELERMLGDTDRARGIFEIAVQQPTLDMPEVLWKGFIDFEVGEEEWEKARELYERLLKRTEHVKVWISFANFEATATDVDPPERLEHARRIFDRAQNVLKRKGPDSKEERVVLMESWREFERTYGDADSQGKIEAKMPKVVKKRRRVEDTGAWEEYMDYVFPDDEAEQKPALKLLQMAHLWKRQQQQRSFVPASSNEDDDDAPREGNASSGRSMLGVGGIFGEALEEARMEEARNEEEMDIGDIDEAQEEEEGGSHEGNGDKENGNGGSEMDTDEINGRER
ncbi:pre-mRNA-splicing factor clf1 [Gonapodya prolifera JEL478]|uniref:Pre-mRNA-splicing factor clf1 n=1 Tax=Gonapodya prolifera (strain JEL478) TaxID=1344416 RepID=A0A139ANA0_GONPJ|nr:pre-mRNA-splicing factor clf1 [Gonapodya prolifera JEL478]|eukprot:KXS18003.1 pre-mRNA-splicing factor clf1 [Gonapodya prolifera JEL478]